MSFSGALDIVELGQVFQMLSTTQKVGRLIVSRPGEIKQIWFQGSNLALQVDHLEYRERVLEILEATEVVPPEEIKSAKQEASRHGGDPLGVLMTLGILNPLDVDQVYQRLMAEEIYHLFEWKGAHFEFIEEKENQNIRQGLQYMLRVENVVMEAARRLDEWSQIRLLIPRQDIVFEVCVVNQQIDFASLTEDEHRVLQAVDGLRSVQAVVRKTGLGDFEANKRLKTLLDRAWVRPIPNAGLIAAGTAAFENKRWSEAANLFEQAQQKRIDLPESIGAAAKAREAMQDYHKAAHHYVAYAQALVEQGTIKRAIVILYQVVDWFPTSLSIREELFRLVADHPKEERPEDYYPKEEGLELAELYTLGGDSPKGLALLRFAANRFSTDRRVLQALANRLEESPAPREAIDVYAALEKLAFAADDIKECIRWNEKILTLDPKNYPATRRLAQLTQDHKKKKKRKHTLTLSSFAAAGFLIVLSLGIIREHRARTVFKTLTAEEQALQGDFANARQQYEKFLNTYAFTFIAAEAEKSLQRLEDMQLLAIQRTAQEKLDEELHHESRLLKAERIYREAETKSNEGKMGEALSQLRQCLAIAPKDWNSREKVENQIDSLERYIRDADTILKRAKNAEHQDNFQQARHYIRQILDQYPHAPAVENITFPYQIETTPPGAKVSWRGQILEQRTPLIVRIPPGTEGFLSLEREGFAQEQIPISSNEDADTYIALSRIPDRVLQLDGLAITEPAVQGDRLYVGLSGGKLAAYSTSSGKLLWTFVIEGFGEITTQPLAAGEHVYFGASDYKIYAIDRWGEAIWSKDMGKTIRSLPLWLHDRLYAATENGEVVSLDADHGQELWRSKLDAGSAAAPIFNGNWLLVGDLQGNIYRFQPNNGNYETIAKINGPVRKLIPVEDLDQFVALGEDGRFTLFEFDGRIPIWQKQGLQESNLNPVVRKNYLYLAQGKELISVHLANGETEGAVSLPVPLTRGLQYAAGALYGKDEEGYWVAVELASKSVRWRAKLPVEEVGFGVDPERVWIMGKDSNLYLFDEGAAQFSFLK